MLKLQTYSGTAVDVTDWDALVDVIFRRRVRPVSVRAVWLDWRHLMSLRCPSKVSGGVAPEFLWRYILWQSMGVGD